MKSKSLTYIIILATITVAGALAMQFFFLKKSYSYSENQFRESVAVALKEVVWQLMAANGNVAGFDSIAPAEIISVNTYRVEMENIIDPELLKMHLTEEFRRHQIYTDFEFATYNPATGLPDVKTRITGQGQELSPDYPFPEIQGSRGYHFMVHFPDLSPYFHSRLSVWYLFTGLLLVIILFFGFTLSVIIRQRQLSQIQKDFINNLTHELKTPISSIALSAKVISDRQILQNPGRLFQYAEIIQEQNNRLSKNVEKVLNLASLEKNKIKLNKEKIDLRAFLAELTASFSHSETGHRARIELKIDPPVCTVVADRFHFSNLILNIMENGIKYCEKEPRIDIRVSSSDGCFYIEFADNGIGISKKYRKKIFKRFFRIPTGNVHNVKGFGLGLDYVMKIVRAHKWKIKVDSNPQGGSIFTLTIPRK